MIDLKISDWLMIAATVTGPILAVQAQKWLERYRTDRDRKEAIFRTLMATRSMILHPDHVRALNGIELAFYSDAKGNVPRQRSAAAVVECWRTYFDHLHKHSATGEIVAGSPEDKRFLEKSHELLTDLLLKMAEHLRYSITEREIKRGAYYPRFFTDAERNNEIIRDGIAKLMRGELTVPISLPGTQDFFWSVLHGLSQSKEPDTAAIAKASLRKWDERTREAENPAKAPKDIELRSDQSGPREIPSPQKYTLSRRSRRSR